MKRSMTNYWVDMITGVAFLFCAVTGLIRLFPEATVSLSATGQPVILGISMSVWQLVHDWSGVVMAAGVGVHTALHFKWLVAMTSKMVRGRRGRRERDRVGTPQTARQVAASTSPKGSRLTATQAAPLAATQTTPLAATPAAPQPATPADPPAAPQRRYTRKSFMAAAAVFGVAAFATGWGLVGYSEDGSAAGSAGSRSSDPVNESAGGAGASAESNGDEPQSDAGASGAESTNSNAVATSNARVVVDAGACTGCEACVQVCPDGVFTMSGGKAVVRDAEACRLCGRCLRVCAPKAITLNA